MSVCMHGPLKSLMWTDLTPPRAPLFFLFHLFRYSVSGDPSGKHGADRRARSLRLLRPRRMPTLAPPRPNTTATCGRTDRGKGGRPRRHGRLVGTGDLAEVGLELGPPPFSSPQRSRPINQTRARLKDRTMMVTRTEQTTARVENGRRTRQREREFWVAVSGARVELGLACGAAGPACRKPSLLPSGVIYRRVGGRKEGRRRGGSSVSSERLEGGREGVSEMEENDSSASVRL